jgi:tRNA dimethylallyltransferase
MKKIFIIAGPTASGKTSLAIDLAKKIDGEIINADSLQVYKENPIISAQPTKLEQQDIPHHLFGYVDGAEDYTVARWIIDVRHKLSTISKTPIIVGGSGFYLKHLIFGLSAIPDIDIEFREEVRHLHGEIGNLDFYNLLNEVDPQAAAKLNHNDYKRVMRAYEVIKFTGKSIDFWQKNNISYFPVSSFSMLILQPSRDLLYANCNQRFLTMIKQGAIEEAEYLMNQGYDPNKGIMKSHGVPEIISYLKGEWSLSEATLKAQQVVRNYAKRQTTWFKHQFNDPNLDIEYINFPDLGHIDMYQKKI